MIAYLRSPREHLDGMDGQDQAVQAWAAKKRHRIVAVKTTGRPVSRRSDSRGRRSVDGGQAHYPLPSSPGSGKQDSGSGSPAADGVAPAGTRRAVIGDVTLGPIDYQVATQGAGPVPSHREGAGRVGRPGRVELGAGTRRRHVGDRRRRMTSWPTTSPPPRGRCRRRSWTSRRRHRTARCPTRIGVNARSRPSGRRGTGATGRQYLRCELTITAIAESGLIPKSGATHASPRTSRASRSAATARTVAGAHAAITTTAPRGLAQALLPMCCTRPEPILSSNRLHFT